MHHCCEEEKVPKATCSRRSYNCCCNSSRSHWSCTPPPVSVISSTATEPTVKSSPKPNTYRHPPLLTLPSKKAIPLNQFDQQFVSYLFLPIAGLRGNALFNAFLTFCSHSEQNAVLVSRAFVSQRTTLYVERVTIRQVP